MPGSQLVKMLTQVRNPRWESAQIIAKKSTFAAIMKKTIIITGATSGIGLETTRLLAGKGYCIFAVGHSAANCEKADRDIRSGMPEADIAWFAGDLMQQREVVRVAGEIKKRLKERGAESLHALINNAGCARSRYMTTEEDYLYLCEQCEPPAGLYFHHGKSKKYNKQVTTENTTRLFELSERLCGIRYE